MRNYALIFWEPSLSPHKTGLFAALKAHPRVRSVTQVVHEGLLSERAAMGWDINDNVVDTVIAPASDQIAAMVRETPKDTIHIFSGIHWLETLVEGLKAVRTHGRAFGIMTEPRASEGLKGLARRLHSLATEGPVRRSADFVLAIGANGPAWYHSTGYSPRRVFPFAYFLGLAPPPQTPLVGRSGKVSVAYIGRLIEAKGFGLFLDALPHLHHVDQISIAGVGEMAGLAEDAARKDGKVAFLGKLPMSEVPDMLQSVDILVQPSLTTDDGWAAIVGEALMSGTCVIATPKVGASVCLAQASNGAVVSELTPIAVAQAIDGLIQRGDFSPAARAARRDWAAAHISAEAGAAHLVDILDHLYEGAPRPPAFYEGEGQTAKVELTKAVSP